MSVPGPREIPAAHIRLTRLHAQAAALDLAGLACILLQACFLLPPEQADRRVLWFTLAVVPIACLVFLLMPRRVQFLPEPSVPRRSLLAYATLALPMAASLLTLALVAAGGSFDAFAGFALLIAADAGRNLCEWLRQRSAAAH